jgi:hypothetical protein
LLVHTRVDVELSLSSATLSSTRCLFASSCLDGIPVLELCTREKEWIRHFELGFHEAARSFAIRGRRIARIHTSRQRSSTPIAATTGCRWRTRQAGAQCGSLCSSLLLR